MVELWSLMDTPVYEQQMFEHITSNIAAEEDEITTPGCLSLENLEQVSSSHTIQVVESLSILVGWLYSDAEDWACE